MPGIGQEGAAVGQHAHEARQVAQVGQGGQLIGHALEVIVEPPGGAVLDLADSLGGLEAATQGVDRLVVGGIQGVQHRAGQVALGLAGPQERRHLIHGRIVVDGVEAGVRAQLLIHGQVVVAAAAVVQLHGPVQLLVLGGEEQQAGGLVLVDLLTGQGLAGSLPGEDGLHLGIGRRLVHDVVQAMVGQAAVVGMEELHPLGQGFLHVGEGLDLYAGGGSQLADVFHELGLFDVHGLVGTPGGPHVGLEGLVGQQLLMVFQVVDGIVRGADGLHVAHFDQAAHGVPRGLQLGVGQVPHLVGGLCGQRALIAEEPLQLQVRPVVQGVADGLADHLGPLAEFLVVAGVAGDVLLLHAGAAHQTPLVVVAAQPHLGNVLIAQVVPDLLGADVAVVVDDRALGGILMIEHAGSFRVEQEILVHELLHGLSLLCLSTVIYPLVRKRCGTGVTGWCHGG